MGMAVAPAAVKALPTGRRVSGCQAFAVKNIDLSLLPSRLGRAAAESWQRKMVSLLEPADISFSFTTSAEFFRPGNVVMVDITGFPLGTPCTLEVVDVRPAPPSS